MARKKAPNQDGYADFLASAAPLPPGLQYLEERRLGREELAAVYEGDAIAARIVDALPGDAMRAAWDIVGADVEMDWRSVHSEVDDLLAIPMIGRSWTWARLQGGALMLPGANDGQPLDKPLDLAKVKSIAGIEALDCNSVRPIGPNPERPDFYEIIRTAQTVGLNGRVAKTRDSRIHPSRVIRFDSYAVPVERLRRNAGWSPSILQRCWTSLSNYRKGQQDLAAMFRRASMLVLKSDGWRQTAMGTAEQKAKLRDYLRELWRSMNAHNLLAIDLKLDHIEEVKRSLEGCQAVAETQLAALVADSGVTRQIITGEQTSTGLNSDTKGERRQWYDHVWAERAVVAEPALNRIIEIVLAARRNRGEVVPSHWTISWEPLEQEAAEDLAKRASQWAEVVVKLLAALVITPEQARTILVGRGVLEQSELDATAKKPPIVPAVAQTGGAGQPPNSPLM